MQVAGLCWPKQLQAGMQVAMDNFLPQMLILGQKSTLRCNFTWFLDDFLSHLRMSVQCIRVFRGNLLLLRNGFQAG